jgi:hypothetical protein
MSENGSERFAHSETIVKIAAALGKMQAVMQPAAKDKTNPHFKAKYADLVSVWEACRKPLTDNGLSVTQLISSESPSVVVVTTMLMHESGEWLRSSLQLSAGGGDPQKIGSAVTYGRRFGLCAMIGVVADDDDDGAAASRPREGYGGGYGDREPPGAEYRQAPQDDTQLQAAIGDWKDAIRDAPDAAALKKVGAQLMRQPDAVKVATREDYGRRLKALEAKKPKEEQS